VIVRVRVRVEQLHQGPRAGQPAVVQAERVGLGRGVRESRGGARPLREDPVEAVDDLLRLGRLLHQLELKLGRLADEVDRTLLVEQAGELDDDPVVPLLLHERLGDAELVDAVPQHLHRAVERVLHLFVAQVRAVELKDEVHPPLQVEPELERLGSQILDRLPGTVPRLHRHPVEAERRNEDPDGRGQNDDQRHEFPTKALVHQRTPGGLCA